MFYKICTLAYEWLQHEVIAIENGINNLKSAVKLNIEIILIKKVPIDKISPTFAYI